MSGEGLLESLEPRIAPATFFLTSSGNVVDSAGQDVSNGTLAAEVGVSKAVLLKKGDSLVFDVNGDGIYDKTTETNLFQVKGGASYLFLNDVAGVGDLPLDITGVAATDKFSAIAHSDVLGDVATMLDGPGQGQDSDLRVWRSRHLRRRNHGLHIHGLCRWIAFSLDGSVSKISITGVLQTVFPSRVSMRALASRPLLLILVERLRSTLPPSVATRRICRSFDFVGHTNGRRFEFLLPETAASSRIRRRSSKAARVAPISNISFAANGQDLSFIAGHGEAASKTPASERFGHRNHRDRSEPRKSIGHRRYWRLFRSGRWRGCGLRRKRRFHFQHRRRHFFNGVRCNRHPLFRATAAAPPDEIRQGVLLYKAQTAVRVERC